MKIPYNTQIIPPAPFLSVRLSNLVDSSVSMLIPAKIDTGADITAIPASLIQNLRLVPADEIIVEGYDGLSTTAALVTLRSAEGSPCA